MGKWPSYDVDGAENDFKRGFRLISNRKIKNHKWFDFHESKNILSVKYRMLSYLPCGLSTERPYIERKTLKIRFFYHLFDHKGTSFSSSN